MTYEQAAETARRKLGVGLDGPIPDLLRLIEDEAGIFVFIVPLGDDGIDGAFQLADQDPFILLNQDRHPVRKRFTLAHEYGHFFMGHGAQLDKKISFGNQAVNEREANGFAASLLVPRPALDHWFARHEDPKVDLEIVVRVASFFNVSAFVARYRLEAVKRIGVSAAARFDEAFAEKEHYQVTTSLGLQRPRDSITSQHTRGAYVPAAMQARIADLLRRRLLTREAAAALLRLSGSSADDQLRELMEPNGPGGRVGEGASDVSAE
jgi:Zn-dependent peptidase ImmA (M78 family)